MKVLFLDIDGVLNSTRSAVAHDGFPHLLTPDHMQMFDICAVGLVRKLCEETGAAVVISSSWRVFHNHQDIGKALKLPVIDATPRLHAIRGEEIKAWLEANSVTKYAIVDDDSDMLPEQMPFFVKTDVKNGLLWDDYERLLHLL